MAFIPSRLTRFLVTVSLLSWAAGFAAAQGQPDSKAGNAPTPSTNAASARPADDSPPVQGRLNHLEDELFGTHQPVDLQRTINDATAGPDRPLPRIIPPDSHTRERLDRQKDWAFSIMNDLDSQPSLEKALGVPEVGPDGRPKKKLSAVQEFWEDKGKPKAAGSDGLMDVLGMEWDMKQVSSTNGFNPLTDALSGGDKTMKGILLLEELNGSADKSSGDETAPVDTAASQGIRAAATAAAEDRDRQRRQDEFNSLLGGTPATVVNPSFSVGGQNNHLPEPPQIFSPVAGSAFSPVAAPVPAPANPTSLSPVMGGYNPSPAGYPYPASTANPASMENLRNLLMPEPKPSATQPSDPFVQNFPKRRF